MEKFIAIETKDGVFISDNIQNNQFSNTHKLYRYLFDGVKGEPTYRSDWLSIKAIPTKIELESPEQYVNYRYVLKDGYPVTDKTPKEFPSSKIDYYEDVLGLYNNVYDIKEASIENVEFEINVVACIDDFKIERKQYEFSVSLLDQINFHPVVRYTLPCKMTRKQTYDIIREYVKQNINGKLARVCSDFDFHFAVEKIIALDVIESYFIDLNALSKRKKPNYEKRYRKDRRVIVLDIAWDSSGAKYTKNQEIIEPFEGENYDDMIKNMNAYLENLIEEINKPIVDCPHCHGLGVIQPE